MVITSQCIVKNACLRKIILFLHEYDLFCEIFCFAQNKLKNAPFDEKDVFLHQTGDLEQKRWSKQVDVFLKTIVLSELDHFCVNYVFGEIFCPEQKKLENTLFEEKYVFLHENSDSEQTA